MNRAPVSDPKAPLAAEIAATMDRFDLISLSEQSATVGQVHLGRKDNPNETVEVFTGNIDDARLYLARIAVAHPHLKTNLAKPEKRRRPERPVRFSFP